jgi:hypothetical protein
LKAEICICSNRPNSNKGCLSKLLKGTSKNTIFQFIIFCERQKTKGFLEASSAFSKIAFFSVEENKSIEILENAILSLMLKSNPQKKGSQ